VLSKFSCIIDIKNDTTTEKDNACQLVFLSVLDLKFCIHVIKLTIQLTRSLSQSSEKTLAMAHAFLAIGLSFT